jgi:hypothetical protein
MAGGRICTRTNRSAGCLGVGCLDVAVALDSEHREESAKPVKVSEPALELLFSCLWSAAQLKPPQIGTHSTASIAPEQ